MPSNHAGVAAMGNSTNITAEYLRQCLDYDPETGLFVWKARPQEHFKDNRAYNSWNARYAGQKAGSFDKNGYLVIGINKKVYKAHRLAFLYVYGWLPKQVDHKNNDGLKSDNRIINLRAANHSTNGMNQGKQKNNTSGLKGVYWFKASNKWGSIITKGYKRIYLGSFDCPAAASFAYQIAADMYHGEFARI